MQRQTASSTEEPQECTSKLPGRISRVYSRCRGRPIYATHCEPKDSADSQELIEVLGVDGTDLEGAEDPEIDDEGIFAAVHVGDDTKKDCTDGT
jgi:hypothetical protein